MDHEYPRIAESIDVAKEEFDTIEYLNPERRPIHVPTLPEYLQSLSDDSEAIEIIGRRIVAIVDDFVNTSHLLHYIAAARDETDTELALAWSAEAIGVAVADMLRAQARVDAYVPRLRSVDDIDS